MTRRGSVLIIAIIVVIIVIVAVLVGWFILQNKPATTGTTPPPSTTTATSSPIDYLPLNELPIAITADMPMDANAEILQNYETNYTNTEQQQSVHEYVTAKTLAQAYADYTNYFNKNDWKIVSTLNQSTTKSIYATLNLTSITVSFATNSVLQQNVVTLAANYYVAPPSNATSVPVIISSIPANILHGGK